MFFYLFFRNFCILWLVKESFCLFFVLVEFSEVIR